VQTPLDHNRLRRLVTLLIPVFQGSTTTRRALLSLAFGMGFPLLDQIDYGETDEVFVAKLINQLYAYGDLQSGQSALWALVEMAAEKRGDPYKSELLSFKLLLNTITESHSDTNAAPSLTSIAHVFVSYTRDDRKIVDRLIVDLNKHGINIWIDQENVKSGTRDWENAIRKALNESRAFILIASPASRDSLYVRDEIAIADDLGVPIFPVWAEGTRWRDCVPLGMGGSQYIDARGEDNYKAALKKLISALTALLPVSPNPPASPPSRPAQGKPRNPYKGLNAFTEIDSGDFFGREGLIIQLLDCLTAYPRFLALLGASGSGKSSVMQAGLLPALKRGAIPGSEHWCFLPPITPRSRPIISLSSALYNVMPTFLLPDIADKLAHKSADGLAMLARQIAWKMGERLVLYIDQFEELFTVASDNERELFINVLTTAANDPDCNLTILLSMRADFYDRPPRYPELGHLIEEHHLQIYPLSLAELYEVVQKPAAAVGLSFEDELATELVYDVRDQAGGLPLLQFTLEQLYVECVEKQRGQKLTRSAYRKIGGVRGALTKHADAACHALAVEQQGFVPELFKRLVNLGETEQETTRRRATRSDLRLSDRDQSTKLNQVVETFIEARLLTSDRDKDGEETLQVAHEALLREWERLRNWLHEARQDIQRGRNIEAAAREWLVNKRSPQYLYRDDQLAGAQSWATRNMPNTLEDEFIQASVVEQVKREKRELQAQAERLRLAEEKAVAEERARIAEQARTTRARFAAITAIIMFLTAAAVAVFAGIREGAARNQEGTAVAHAATAAAQVGYNVIEIARFGTLAAGGIAIPLLTQTPSTFVPALTQIAALNQWSPAARDFGNGVTMMEVPAGCFFMGSVAFSGSNPIEQVCFDVPFWIDQTEVTRAQYHQCVETGPCTETVENPFSTRDTQPINGVNWFQAYTYCTWRGARLPTDAEWEYAARGPDSLNYPWGNEWDGDKVAWYGNLTDETADVGSRPQGASWVGALDMSGNLWEWVSTIYDESRPPDLYATDDGREDVNRTDVLRVLRGGSWYINNPELLSAAFRYKFHSVFQDFFNGFRCAQSLE
jgi:formylglycine-generating enzyme required for sulfatase activity